MTIISFAFRNYWLACIYIFIYRVLKKNNNFGMLLCTTSLLLLSKIEVRKESTQEAFNFAFTIVVQSSYFSWNRSWTNFHAYKRYRHKSWFLLLVAPNSDTNPHWSVVTLYKNHFSLLRNRLSIFYILYYSSSSLQGNLFSTRFLSLPGSRKVMKFLFMCVRNELYNIIAS